MNEIYNKGCKNAKLYIYFYNMGQRDHNQAKIFLAGNLVLIILNEFYDINLKIKISIMLSLL